MDPMHGQAVPHPSQDPSTDPTLDEEMERKGSPAYVKVVVLPWRDSVYPSMVYRQL